MIRKPSHYDELTQLISGLLDARLSPEESARLQSLLEADPNARRLYMQMIDQEVELSCLVALPRSEKAPGAEAIEIRPEFRLPSEKSGFRRRWALAAAAIILLAIGVLGVALRFRSTRTTPEPTIPKLAPSISWAEDFESGIAPSWTGRIVSTGLPQGSKFGISAVPVPYQNQIYYAIKFPEDWQKGLFELRERSVLHVTYKLSSRLGLNVFMHTIPPNWTTQGYGMFQLLPSKFPGKPDGWQTASIPFSKFVRKVRAPNGQMQFIGGPPLAGEIITTMAFSTPEELDLVIDRIWVTATGTENEEIIVLDENKNSSYQ